MVLNKGNIIIGKKPSANTQIEIELGKNLILNSITSLNDYAKNMIPVVGTIAALYSGLLKIYPQDFLEGISPYILFIPIVIFLLAIVIFMIAYLPGKKVISLNVPSSIVKAYIELSNQKKIYSTIGTILFTLAILIMSVVLIFLLK